MLDVRLYEVLINTKSTEECAVTCLGGEDCLFQVDYADGSPRSCIYNEEESKLFKKAGYFAEEGE